jgi:hypothetical protein
MLSHYTISGAPIAASYATATPSATYYPVSATSVGQATLTAISKAFYNTAANVVASASVAVAAYGLCSVRGTSNGVATVSFSSPTVIGVSGNIAATSAANAQWRAIASVSGSSHGTSSILAVYNNSSAHFTNLGDKFRIQMLPAFYKIVLQ